MLENRTKAKLAAGEAAFGCFVRSAEPSLIEYVALLGWDFQEAGGQGDYRARIGIHEVAIPYMGLPLLDNANFERLAEVCVELGRWEFLFVVAPLVVNGGTGSPVNPIAVF